MRESSFLGITVYCCLRRIALCVGDQHILIRLSFLYGHLLSAPLCLCLIPHGAELVFRFVGLFVAGIFVEDTLKKGGEGGKTGANHSYGDFGVSISEESG